jgi:hypothetical protein
MIAYTRGSGPSLDHARGPAEDRTLVLDRVQPVEDALKRHRDLARSPAYVHKRVVVRDLAYATN